MNTPFPAPHSPVPSPRQLSWHALEFYGFIHFTVNTFTDKEWGYGDESPAVFNPTHLDARQWARTARAAGMRGLILTAKHHDGFCLWPSAHTAHSVRHSPWRAGRGDVVREFVDACREFDLAVGLYLSPWDRNHADYGRPAYIDYYRRQLDELSFAYGPLFEFWFDGANGGDGYYGGARETRTIDRANYYGYEALWAAVRRHQPDACLFSDGGPDIRWVGNEEGLAPVTCWAKVRPEGFAPGAVEDLSRLGSGDADGSIWRPAEADVSIRPGWFHHPAEEPKPLSQLIDIFFASIGRGTSLLFNLPPDRRGLLPDNDVTRLAEFRQALDATLARDWAAGCAISASHERAGGATPAAHLTDGRRDTFWAPDDVVRAASLVVTLPSDVARIGAARIEEFIELGQRVERFAVDVLLHGNQWQEVAVGTTIGPQRIVRFAPCRASRLRLRILAAQACPVLRRLAVY